MKAPFRAGVVPETFASPDAAWAWFETEYPVFMDVIRLAAAGGMGHSCLAVSCSARRVP